MLLVCTVFQQYMKIQVMAYMKTRLVSKQLGIVSFKVHMFHHIVGKLQIDLVPPITCKCIQGKEYQQKQRYQPLLLYLSETGCSKA